MHIGRLARTLALAIWVLPCLLVASVDRSRQTDPIRLAFLGRLTESEDSGFSRFHVALARMPEPLLSRLHIQFFSTIKGEPEDIERAVDLALATQPHIIIAPSSATALSVKKRNSGTPVVFASFLDPVRYALVGSTTQRDEPMTGVWISDDLDGKRLELLRDAYPGIRSVALLIDRDWGENAESEKRLPDVARQLGLSLTVLYAEDLEEATRVLENPQMRLFDAWCLPPTGLAFLNSKKILDRLRSWGKPVMASSAADVESGASLSYALDYSFAWPAMVDLLGRILQGESANSIPIQRPMKSVLAVRPVPAEGFPPPSAQVVRRADVVVR